MQMFAPADALLDLDAARVRLEGLEGADADHDRATLDFYLAGTLMNLRRFDEATTVFTRSAVSMAALEPTSLIRLWAASGAAIGQTLLGDPDAAMETLAEVELLTDWTDWAVEWAYAQALALAYSGQLDRRRANHCAGSVPDSARTIRRPSCRHWWRGSACSRRWKDRPSACSELFELLTATRSPASTAATYEVIGDLEGWSDDGFANARWSGR